jgi:hypothetical protein
LTRERQVEKFAFALKLEKKLKIDVWRKTALNRCSKLGQVWQGWCETHQGKQQN